MKKSDLIAALGSQKAIAEQLGITPSAVSQWEEELPELQVYRIRERIPDIEERIAEARRQLAA